MARSGGSGPMLRAEFVRKTYGKRTVLDVEAIEVRRGETLALLGPSGSGKTTLLSVLALLERPDSGRVLFEGVEVSVRHAHVRRQMAAAFQSPYLFRGSVGQNVAYGLKLRRVRRAERSRAVAEALERVGLGGWERRSALTLSGGEAQRVALARAIVLKPRVLFLDEPLSSLDPLIKNRLAADFARIIREESMTTVYVTHDQSEAITVADNIVVMRDGRVAVAGSVDDVVDLPPDEWTARFFGAEAPLSGVVTWSRDGLIGVDVGGVVVCAPGELALGARVAIAVRPEEVVLFEGDAEIPLSSARNRLSGTVVDIQPWGVLYRVAIEVSGARLASLVSRSSVVEMGIVEGSRVQIVFKAASVRVRAERACARREVGA